MAQFLESQVKRLEQYGDAIARGSAPPGPTKQVQVLKIEQHNVDGSNSEASDPDLTPLTMLLHTLTERLAAAIGAVEPQLTAQGPEDTASAAPVAADTPAAVRTKPVLEVDVDVARPAAVAGMVPGLALPGSSLAGGGEGDGVTIGPPKSPTAAAVAATAAALAAIEDEEEEVEENEEEWIATLRPFTPLVRHSLSRLPSHCIVLPAWNVARHKTSAVFGTGRSASASLVGPSRPPRQAG
eukprot:SAG11_NODE_5928_length_1431_cov_2.343093_2_plen_240_part_00